jgi:hypothetical protein
VVLDSLDILLRLERDFPDDSVVVASDGRWVQDVVRSSGAFDCDGDDWLANTDPAEDTRVRPGRDPSHRRPTTAICPLSRACGHPATAAGGEP